jgi:cardiolipin synthase
VLQRERGYLHAKTVVVDGDVASVGSGVWDMRSLCIDHEINAVLYDEELAGSPEAACDADRAGCRRFAPRPTVRRAVCCACATPPRASCRR